MDLEAAKKLIENPSVQKYIATIDGDAEIALKEKEATIAGMDDYPDKYRSEYKRDAKALDDAWGDFNAEWNTIVFGKAKDGKAAMSAYKKYVITLGILEQQNVRFGAYVDADAAYQATFLITAMMAYVETLKKRIRDVQDELKELDKVLRKVNRLLDQAEIQRAANLAINSLTLMLTFIPGIGTGASFAISIGSSAVGMILDEALGPNKTDLPDWINTSVGLAGDYPKLFKPKYSKFISAGTALYDLYDDTDEVGEAKAMVEKAKKKIKDTEKALDQLNKLLVQYSEKLPVMHKALKASIKEAAAAAKTYKSAEAERMMLLKELAKLK